MTNKGVHIRLPLIDQGPRNRPGVSFLAPLMCFRAGDVSGQNLIALELRASSVFYSRFGRTTTVKKLSLSVDTAQWIYVSPFDQSAHDQWVKAYHELVVVSISTQSMLAGRFAIVGRHVEDAPEVLRVNDITNAICCSKSEVKYWVRRNW